MTVRAFAVPRVYCLWSDRDKYEFLRQNAPRAPMDRLQRAYDLLQIRCAARSVGGERPPGRVPLRLSHPAGQTSTSDTIATIDADTGDVLPNQMDGGSWLRIAGTFAAAAAVGFVIGRR